MSQETSVKSQGPQLQNSSPDDMERIKHCGLTVLSLVKHSLTDAQYQSLQAIFQFKSQIGINLISKWTIDEWKKAVGDSFAAQMFYSLFRDNNTQLTMTVPESKQAAPQDNCNINDNITNETSSTVMGIFSTALPVSKGWDKSGYSNKPLHLKTDWLWKAQKNNSDAHIMYNIEFKGHLFRANKPIFIIAVGYLYGTRGHTYDSIQYLSDGVKLTVYQAKEDGKVVFKLETENNTDWHASDLVLNLIGGKSVYHQRAKNSLKIIDVFIAVKMYNV